MALVVYDRVQQTGSANTTVSFTLSGSVAGYQSFAVVGNGNTTFYAATDAGGNWEVGIGTYSTTGPTLTRTTILSSSSSGTAVSTFSGTVNVFVTYPSEKSVNLDASGNVTALGTITSGVWNGTTIPVAYGGTGVTASTGANSVVLRDSNVNISANNTFNGWTTTSAAGTTTTLTAASTYYQKCSGTTTQTFKLPDATTLPNGATYIFDNDSTGTITITDNSGATVDTIPTGCADYIYLEANGTSAGSWSNYAFIPDTYDFSPTTASFGNAIIANATWNGGTIGVTYGGTGLNSISTSNYAIYSSAANTLTAGTLPVLAGGTGVTTSTGTGSVVLNTSPALVTPNIGSATATSLAVTAASITSSSTSNLSVGGALGFSDTGIVAHETASTNSYLQHVIQNQSSGTQASAEFIAYNNNGTASTNFATVGINSSGYTGVGSINAAGNAYFLSGSTDLVLGTIGANSIRVVTNSQATDAITVNTNNAVAFNGSYGTSAYLLQSNGSGGANTWVNPSTLPVAASSLTGGTLASGVTASSITSFGASIALGTPASGNFSSGTFTWPTFNQNTTGTANNITAYTISQSMGTANSVQFGSFGVGTAASGTTGEIRATNNVTAYYSSDRQFKENIEEISNAPKIVGAIGGKLFDWTDTYLNAHGGEDGYFVQKHDFGVIAQDVQAVFPRAVRIREDGTLAVDYAKLSALALAAIAELTKRIEALESK